MCRADVIKALKIFRDAEGELKILRELVLPEQEKRQEEQLLRQIQEDVSRAINDLPHTEKDAVWSHYVKGQTWAVVRRRHCYSEKQIRNKANNGLQQIGKALETSSAVRTYLQRKSVDHTS